MASKPTQRCLKDLKDLGFERQVVERFCIFSKRRIDLFGIIDILAIRPGIGVLGIQVTSGSNHAARRTKACAEPRLKMWLDSGGRFEIWSYAKKGARGKRKTWQLFREELKVAREDPNTLVQEINLRKKDSGCIVCGAVGCDIEDDDWI